MISPELEAEILRLYHAEKWRIGTSATQLGVHHTTVRRVLAQAGIAAGKQVTRASIADPFIPLIVETLEKYPRLLFPVIVQPLKKVGEEAFLESKSISCIEFGPMLQSVYFKPLLRRG